MKSDISVNFYQVFFLTCLCAAISCLAAGLTLPDAQKLLYNNNRDVQIAEMRFLKSMDEVIEAKAAYYPSAEMFAAYGLQSKENRLVTDMDLSAMIPALYQALKIPVPSQQPRVVNHVDEPVGDYDRFEWGVDLSYPLFTGFTRQNSIKAKEASGTTFCQSLILTKEMLSVKLGLLFFQWELAVKRIEVQQTYIDQVSEYVVQAANLYESGVMSRTKVLEASARLEAAKVDLLGAQSSFDSLRLELMDFIRCGDSVDMPEPYTYELSAQAINAGGRSYRSEIVILDSTLSALRHTEKAILGRRFPSLNVMAGYRVGNPGIIMGGDEFVDWGVAGLQFRWILYDGQKNWAQREQLRQEIDILRKERDKQLAYWEKSAAVYRLQLEKSHRMKTAAELSQKAAEALAEDLKNALSAGVVSSTDYINALAGVSQARFRVAQAETLHKSVSLQLAFALGETIEF
jgi:outer membrane protein TolC